MWNWTRKGLDWNKWGQTFQMELEFYFSALSFSKTVPGTQRRVLWGFLLSDCVWGAKWAAAIKPANNKHIYAETVPLQSAVNGKVTKHLRGKNWSSVSVTFYQQEASNCMKLLMFVVDFLLLTAAEASLLTAQWCAPVLVHCCSLLSLPGFSHEQILVAQF